MTEPDPERVNIIATILARAHGTTWHETERRAARALLTSTDPEVTRALASHLWGEHPDVVLAVGAEAKVLDERIPQFEAEIERLQAQNERLVGMARASQGMRRTWEAEERAEAAEWEAARWKERAEAFKKRATEGGSEYRSRALAAEDQLATARSCITHMPWWSIGQTNLVPVDRVMDLLDPDTSVEHDKTCRHD